MKVIKSTQIDHTGGVAVLVKENDQYKLRIFNPRTKYEISPILFPNKKSAERAYHTLLEAIFEKNPEGRAGFASDWSPMGWDERISRPDFNSK